MTLIGKEWLEIYIEYLEYFKFILMQEALKKVSTHKEFIYFNWQFTAYDELIKKLKDISRSKEYFDPITWKKKTILR